MRELVEIKLREVQLSKSRPTQPEIVNALAESMAENGLINPIIVKRAKVYDGIMVDGYKVVAGNHRVSAARALGWERIDAFVVGDDLKSELVEIDENLCRAELSPAQRAATIQRRKEIWDALHPEQVVKVETKKSGTSCSTLSSAKTGRGNTQFAADTAKVSGQSKQDINRHVARAEALGSDLSEVVGTSLDKGVELDALKEMKPEARKELIQRAKAGEQVSARNLIPMKKANPDPAPSVFCYAISQLQKASQHWGEGLASTVVENVVEALEAAIAELRKVRKAA